MGRADTTIKGFARSATSTLNGVGTRGLAGITSALAKAAAAAAGAIAAAGAGLGVGLVTAVNNGRELTQISARTGAAVGDVMVLRRAFEDAGLTADKVGFAVNRLQKALAGVNGDGKPTGQVFQQLGISLELLRHSSPQEQLELIGKAINRIHDPAERTARVMAIFGKQGGELLALFNNSGALSGAANTLGRQAEIMQRNAETFREVSVILSHAGTKLSGFFAGMAEKIAPVILPMLQQLDNLDFGKWGEQIGQAIAIMVQAFASGRVSELLGLALKIGAADGINYLFAGFRATASAFATALGESIQGFVEAFGLVRTAAFWSGLGSVLAGLAMKFSAWMLRGLQSPVIAMQASFQYLAELMRDWLIDAFNGPIALLRGGMQFVMQELLNGLLKIPGMKKLLRMDEVHDSFASMVADARKNNPFSDSAKTNPDLLKIYQDQQREGAKLFGASADEIGKKASAALAKGTNDLGPLMKQAGKSISDSAGAIGKSFAQSFRSSPVMFDTSKARATFGKAISDITRQVDAAQKKTAKKGEFKPFGGIKSALDKTKAATEQNGKKSIQVVASSLAKIGGGGYASTGAIALQREGNSLLRRIASNTTPQQPQGGLKSVKLQPASFQ